MTERASLIKKEAYLEGEFITRAGHKTTYYIDKYKFTTQPHILSLLADSIAALLPDPAAYDRLAAPELGAVPIVAAVALRVKKPFVIVKKQPKEYGTNRLIEGGFFSGEKMVLLEDIITTGGAVLRAYDVLVEQGVQVVKIIGVVNREEGGMASIASRKIPATALVTTTQLQAC